MYQIPRESIMLKSQVLFNFFFFLTLSGVACGHNFTLAWTSEGQLYSWGRGQHGALGHGDAKDVPTPRRVAREVGGDSFFSSFWKCFHTSSYPYFLYLWVSLSCTNILSICLCHALHLLSPPFSFFQNNCFSGYLNFVCLIFYRLSISF